MRTDDLGVRTILLCVAGMTPQIITETLWAMTQQRGERVDEVRVITTLGGRRHLMETLLGAEGGKFYEFCRDYAIPPGSIKFDDETISVLRRPDGSNLEDIRNLEENELAGDQICEFVRELTRDPATRVHASAAGGRKTMSIYLTAAMQLFGRADDTLSHILVSEEFEGHKEFYYPPPAPRSLVTRDGREVSTSDARVHLADIQFIRLRGVGAEWRVLREARNYRDMVQQAQTDLDLVEAEDVLQIDLRHRRLVVRGRQVKLTPREMFFYLLFADARSTEDGDGALRLRLLRRERFERVLRRITAALDDEVGLEEAEAVGHKFLTEMLDQLEAQGAKADVNFEAFRDKVNVTLSRIRSKLKGINLPDDYCIKLYEAGGEGCYRLPLAPHRIKFN